MTTGEEAERSFAVREGYAMYRGPSPGGACHGHAAFQIAIALQGEVAMVDAAGIRHRAEALVVPPLARHRMLATAGLLTFYIEPQCAFADRLREYGGAGLVAAPELRALDEAEVRRAVAPPSRELDPRLLAAMGTLAGRPIPMPELAAGVGLSPQRLRALARHQLGMPLPRLRVWLRLRRAVEALRQGQSLAEAAATSGFADQAHFTRQMGAMMGLTPAAVLPALRPSVPARDVDRDRTAER
ncbi:helix-turn-helix domain-containing protein [Streptomyces sp. 8L]|uniref:helix-turn-helix domain-containing protein n=1 Tax=Streptomyces sp. 8L TaxID=2877242 RepID=UPI001CD59261|nr:AraC family transcriptional regulator [Streptomyces sp. 8L]MCA1220362.1 AraC family transcriptional regulator [Streptomyces sp. 8L]